MAYLVFLGITLVLFIGYFAFTMVEARTGTHVLNASRTKMDRSISRAIFIAQNVKWGDFFVHVAGSAAARIAHDVVHFTLIAVRFMERQLTRAVRALRDRRPNVLAPKPSRVSPISQTVAYVRKMLHITKERS